MTIIVRKKPGESDDKLIGAFKKKILFEKVVEELKEKTYYTKPSRARYMKLREKQRQRNWNKPKSR
jgi:ribosomal protein S21